MDQFAQPQNMPEGIVAVEQLALHNGDLFASTFTHAWPVEPAVPFEELLREIDEANAS